MKVDFSNSCKKVSTPTFDQLKSGDCFTFPSGNVLYMKSNIDGHKNVVSLSDGLTYSFRNDADVFPRSNAVVMVNGV